MPVEVAEIERVGDLVLASLDASLGAHLPASGVLLPEDGEKCVLGGRDSLDREMGLIQHEGKCTAAVATTPLAHRR